ncbi:MAG: lysophospholipid acyltransferase family protein [Proteobacteria bacterium]|nr:lysophospholipid acyltransferase family protein [Pseudomonadota bacterium]MBU1739166.1 lysophospholipid acyltransferase family protein [Pseudomonadota bacterium]
MFTFFCKEIVEKKHPIKKIRDDIFYLLVLVLIKLLRALPRKPALLFMRSLGRLAFILSKNPRKRAIAHLGMVFPDKSREEIITLARKVFIHFATAIGDLVRLPRLIDSGLNDLVTASGTEHLDRAFATGRGLILITCHFGNWELLGAWLVKNGYPMSVVGTTLFDERLDRFLVDTRNNAGYTNIARGKGTREIMRTLKKGHSVGMLIDQDTKAQGVFVNFFGRQTHTPTGPAVLARKLDLPIIPIFMYLKDDLTYHLECQPPLDLVRTANEEKDIRSYTQQCSDAYEGIIRRFPEQWVWMHKRWKTQPEAIEKETGAAPVQSSLWQ